MDEELHDVVVVVVTDVHVFGHQNSMMADKMPITGKLMSVTAYSNSIHDNILLARLLFQWVK
jgi:hypothetical protein